MARAMRARRWLSRIGLLGGRPGWRRQSQTAAKIGGWDGGGPGSNLGLSCASLFGSHIGLMAEATVGADQRIKVAVGRGSRCGRIVNIGLVRQRVEGALLSALASAIVPEPSYIAGMLRAAPMRGRGYERLRLIPDRSGGHPKATEEPGGVSGLGMAVLAPAVANAIAAGTGKRLRNLPFDPMGAA
jgi:isoquinoline 1-oxidoreductase beta subunit